MTQPQNRLFMSIVLFFSAFVLQTAHADDVTVAIQDQLTIQLPDVDRDALIEKLRTLRSQLIQRKQVLVQSVAEKEMDGGDAIIAAIMPGGLIYAGYKKARHAQAQNELVQISDDIEEFSDDLVAMQYGAAPVFVAQLP